MNEQQIVVVLQQLGFKFWGSPGRPATLAIDGQQHPLGTSQHLAHPNYEVGSVYIHTCGTIDGQPGVLVATGPELKSDLQKRRASNAIVAARYSGATEYPAWIDVRSTTALTDLIGAIRCVPF